MDYNVLYAPRLPQVKGTYGSTPKTITCNSRICDDNRDRINVDETTAWLPSSLCTVRRVRPSHKRKWKAINRPSECYGCKGRRPFSLHGNIKKFVARLSICIPPFLSSAKRSAFVHFASWPDIKTCRLFDSAHSSIYEVAKRVHNVHQMALINNGHGISPT